MTSIDWGQLKKAPTAVEQLQAVKDNLKASVTAKRWEVETGGIVIDGMRLLTGTEDQNRITAVVANARRAGIDEVDFKAGSGWVRISVGAVEQVATAIARHVQASFTAERAHHEAIDALSDLAAVAAYDISQGWVG